MRTKLADRSVRRNPCSGISRERPGDADREPRHRPGHVHEDWPRTGIARSSAAPQPWGTRTRRCPPWGRAARRISVRPGSCRRRLLALADLRRHPAGGDGHLHAVHRSSGGGGEQVGCLQGSAASFHWAQRAVTSGREPARAPRRAAACRPNCSRSQPRPAGIVPETRRTSEDTRQAVDNASAREGGVRGDGLRGSPGGLLMGLLSEKLDGVSRKADGLAGSGPWVAGARRSEWRPGIRTHASPAAVAAAAGLRAVSPGDRLVALPGRPSTGSW